MICKIIFEIFGSNYFVFNLINILIGISIYFTIYEIQKALKIDKLYSAFNTLIIFTISVTSVTALANYNTLSLEFMLLGLLYTIKNYENRPKKYEFIQSIFVTLTILTDQKIGVRLYNRIYSIREKN